MSKDFDSGLREKLQVQSLDKVDESSGKQIIEQVQSGAISKEEWDYLGLVVPRFMDVVSAGLTSVGTVSSAVVTVQTEALKAINEGIKAARDIAMSSDDPAIKMRAFDTIDKGFSKAGKMNKKNNSVWQKAFPAIGLLALCAVTVIGGRRSA